MKQASGSYYAHQDTTGLNRWEGVGSASALAKAVSRTPFFNGNGGQHGRRATPTLPPSQISSSSSVGKRRKRRGMKSSASTPASLFSNPRQESALQQPRRTHMSLRQGGLSTGSVAMRGRQPVESKSRGDLFDERNVLGRLATVGSLGKSAAAGGAEPEADTLDFNVLDGGW